MIRSIRLATLRFAAGTFLIGLASFAATVLPASASAVSTSVRSTPIGALLAKLRDPAATSGDYFGYSVAVLGKTAVVGAFGTDSYAGAAYIYQA
jgi:FG-GAP repeat